MGKSSRTQVRDAAKKNDLDGMKSILKAHPKTAKRALFQVAQYGRAEIAQWILSNYDIQNLDEALTTAVMPRATIPTHEGHLEIAKMVLERGANPNARGGWNEEPSLIGAASGGFHDFVDLLLEYGAKVTICEASALGRVDDVTQFLNEDKNSVHEVHTSGMMPLHCCARSALGNEDDGYAERLAQTARLLIEAGADVRIGSVVQEGKTFNPEMPALNWACSVGNRSVVEVLLANGADVTHVSKWGPPMRQSTLNHPEIAELLLEHGADVNQVFGDDGETALHGAANFPHPKSVEWLLAHGADPKVTLKDGRTPLHRAAERNASARVSKMLIEAGADVNAKCNEGMTPLGYAILKKKHKVADYLREQGGHE